MLKADGRKDQVNPVAIWSFKTGLFVEDKEQGEKLMGKPTTESSSPFLTLTFYLEPYSRQKVRPLILKR